MKLFTHTGDGAPVRAESAKHAAAILARRMYGRNRGAVGALRLDSEGVYSTGRRDGSSTWQAFIGKHATKKEGGNGVTGSNVFIYEPITKEGKANE